MILFVKKFKNYILKENFYNTKKNYTLKLVLAIFKKIV